MLAPLVRELKELVLLSSVLGDCLGDVLLADPGTGIAVPVQYPGGGITWIHNTMDPPNCFSAGMLHAVELIAIRARLTGSMETLLAWSPHIIPGYLEAGQSVFTKRNTDIVPFINPYYLQ